MFWKHKNVLVTGANGFIGSWLTKELVSLGAQVTALVRDLNFESTCLNNMHLVFGKLEDFSLLERILNEYDIDTVFHLGAQTLVEVAMRSPFQSF